MKGILMLALLLWVDFENPWQRILYRRGKDFFIGSVRSGQLGFEPADN